MMRTVTCIIKNKQTNKQKEEAKKDEGGRKVGNYIFISLKNN